MNSYSKNYPRPQFFREKYKILNGKWDFAFDDENIGEENNWPNFFEKEYDITVPFSYETKLSGIGKEEAHNQVWYHKIIDLDKDFCSKNLILHFEGSDYITKVWVNGQFIGMHEGGYARFSFDITKHITLGENEITVKVEDSLSTYQTRGKQRWTDKNFSCFYVQTTGIWKTVWLESVDDVHLSNIKMTPDIHNDCIKIYGQVAGKAEKSNVQIDISFKGTEINSINLPVKNGEFNAEINLFKSQTAWWGVEYWSPNNPALYDISFKISKDNDCKDTVLSYFGMREIRIKGQNILLNDNPIYQRLILDQGYWQDSHLTPPDEQAIIDDIDKIHALGYNGVRKHQKIEDERFLYWCDVKGMLVWSEMAASYAYSDYALESFTKQWLEVVKQNYNHPSIITWTPFNESWGIRSVEVDFKQQKFTEAIYNLTKSIDDMRPVIVNDGWEHTVSDIISLHDYETDAKTLLNRYKDEDAILSNKRYHNNQKAAFANGYQYKGQPVIISEYGGIAFNNGNVGWGYGDKVNDEKAFLLRFRQITNAIKKIPYVCGYCYTQVTDVQQEVNGLMYENREFKIAPEKIKEINLEKVQIEYR